ncbi:plasmid partitioning protein (plasmid) [Streptomyces sp. NBC_01591]|uniref:ParB/RepB/Spo0J family partition protein n=1 Tax=Streptomyces sp. NBC_01591 TaxID=2975888 RepID=UPI002DD7B57F|nr:KorB domain-containing protein [Streptomyces sp. NBC_01591]WSD74696.1 plasmid partitioning protein [Streptomyces sp. NBC_01591]
MSVADRLGTGSSFGSVPRGRSARGRAKALVQGDVPAYELQRLRLAEVSPTPLNPRRNFGSDEDLTRFGEELRTAQLAACVAVSRDAYLRLWPEHEDTIGSSAFVLVNGERRYRSALHVALDVLDFVVRDDLAASREEFVDHLLKENLEREDFDVVERARGVLELVRVCSEESEKGARTRAAKRLGRDRSWVTNQLALLELPDELQTMLSRGSLPERDGRLLARRLKDEPGLDGASLLSYLKDTREQEARVRDEEKALLQQARQQRQVPAPQPPQDDAGTASTATPDEAPAAGTGGLPDGLLSADNKPLDSVTPGRVLSADNTLQEESAAAASGSATPPPPAGAAAVLSADNKLKAPGSAGHSPTPSAPQPGDVPAHTAVLSADNTHAAAAEDGGQGSGDGRSRLLVRQLGTSAREQARTLAAGLTPDELSQLLGELRSYV